MERGVLMDLIPQRLKSTDGENGTQSFSIEGQSYTLELDGRKMCVWMSKPTKDDYDTLPTYEMNSSDTFNSEIDSLPKPRRLNNKKMRTIRRK